MPSQPQVMRPLVPRESAPKTKAKFFKKIRCVIWFCSLSQNHSFVIRLGIQKVRTWYIDAMYTRTASMKLRGARERGVWGGGGGAAGRRGRARVLSVPDGDVDRDVRDTGENQPCIPQYSVLSVEGKGLRRVSTAPQKAEHKSYDDGVLFAPIFVRVDNLLTESFEFCELLRPELSTAIGVKLSKADCREEAFQATKFIQR